MWTSGRRTGTRRILPAAVIAVAAMTVAPRIAAAQFFWNQSSVSADDAARTAIRMGYRVLARPVRNDDVYVADVIDRRGEREQLMISADTGRIVQRFYVDAGPRPYGDPSIAPGPVPPGRIPAEDRRPGLFSRLFGGDAADPEEPAPVGPDRPFVAPDEPVPPPRARHRRVVDREQPDTFRQAPVESAPLAPPTAITPHRAAPAPARHAPAEAALPPPAATPAPAVSPAPSDPDHPVRSISRNPLAIPGSREQDEKSAKAAEPKKPAAPSSPAAPAQPLKPAVPDKGSVVVAPLE